MTDIETMPLEDIVKYTKDKSMKALISEIELAVNEGRLSDIIYRDVTLGKYRMYSILVENKPKEH